MASWADNAVGQGRWAGCGLAGTLISGFGHVPRCGPCQEAAGLPDSWA